MRETSLRMQNSTPDLVDGQALPAAAASDMISSYAEAMDAFEKQLLLRALAQCGNNVAQAAKCLGIGRSTLYKKLIRLHIVL